MTTDPGELAGELNEANRLLDIAEKQRALLAAKVKVLMEAAARAGEQITQLAVERIRAEAEVAVLRRQVGAADAILLAYESYVPRYNFTPGRLVDTITAYRASKEQP